MLSFSFLCAANFIREHNQCFRDREGVFLCGDEIGDPVYGYFSIDSNHQNLQLPGLLDAKGRFLFTGNRAGFGGILEDASVQLIPLNLSLNGNMVLGSQAIQAGFDAKPYHVSGLIEISPASWLLDWKKQNSFSLKADNPSLKILNIGLISES